MNNKQTLKAIINYLSNNNYYYCYQDEQLFQDGECYCVDNLLQKAYDCIYISCVEPLRGYRIDPKKALKEEAIQELIERVQEQADQNHFNFNNSTFREAQQAIQDEPALKQIVLERFKNSAHK